MSTNALVPRAVDAVRGRKVDLDCLDGAAEQFKLASGIDELRIVCSNQEIESVDGTLSGEFASNAGGGAGDDGERPGRAVLVLERRCGFGVRRGRGHGFITTLRHATPNKAVSA